MAALGTTGDAVAWLRTPGAVRSRCDALLAAAERDGLGHFALHREALADAARYVADTVRARYPDLAVPYHSRWRHFTIGGIDRWAAFAKTLDALTGDEIARLRLELTVISVLLDAGAGAEWRYVEPGTGLALARSEGLAVASFHLLTRGAFSDDREGAFRADAGTLARLDADALAAAFQVSAANPLAGLEGRAGLLRRLGGVLEGDPDLFGAEHPRLGRLYDHLKGRAEAGRLPATVLLDVILRGLGPIWPGGTTLGGVNLGDVWRHPAIRADDLTDGLVPFHKLSQWLAYSLVEPLEDSGLTVTDLDALTGLAEYRNGGLFVDLGVLEPRHEGVTGETHDVGSEVVVEWRALTVALLDRIAGPVRAELGVGATDLPLAKVLEGGTWAAGRRIARERRPGGGPPIRVVSDGTVF